MEYARVEELVERPIAEVWAVVSAFGAIRFWIDGVESCAVEGFGVGAIRTVVRGGAATRERLELVDCAGYTVRYALIPPHRVAASDVRSTITLQPVSEAVTRLVWVSEATEFQVAVDQLGEYICGFFRQSISNLRQALVHGWTGGGGAEPSRTGKH